MTTKITLNPGAQKAFVEGDDYYSAYIGGLGSGKTFGGLARALRFAMQPKTGFHGPRGIIAAESYPVLNDVIVPQFAMLYEDLELGAWEKNYRSQERKLRLPNGGEVLFRSLDSPDRMRGVEISWFYIDEGRNVKPDAWKILTSRLRQPGYKRGGWVCSTPAGYDWMWRTFHPDSQDRWPNAVWYNAPTHENTQLPPEYIDDLERNLHGKWYEQEVLGRFVGVMEGAVFPDYDERKHRVPELRYAPDLPLYSFWDFGIGDLGVCLFAQLEYRTQLTTTGTQAKVPVLRFIGEIAAKDWTSADWAAAWEHWLRENAQGARPVRNFGDPAGRKRNEVTGTSVIQDLAERNIPLIAAPKKPQDYSIRILSNMMAGDRVLVSDTGAPELSKAFVSHHWATKDGERTGINPVHDWSSHYVDAARYGAASLISFFPRGEDPENDDRPFTPQQYGFVFQQLVGRNSGSDYFGRPRANRPTFDPRTDVREANR